MRNLQECQAEVFRRSEKRIKARRQRRNRMLLACIPLVLCVTVLGVLLLPGAAAEPGGNSGPPDAALGALPELQGESYLCSIASITVTGSGVSKTYTDTSRILAIWDRLQAFSGADGGQKENANPKDPIYSSTAGYTITLALRDGSITSYSLSGNTLKNLTKNQSSHLSREQTDELIALLGIFD